MRWFRSEVRARNFVLGFFGLVGICMIVTIIGITVSATLRAPRTVDDFDPFVATGVAEMATYQAAQTEAEQSGEPTPTAASEEAAPPAAPGEPTGQIVYTCFLNFNDDLCIVNADGSNQRQLTSANATDWYAALSADGRLIAYSSRATGSFEAYLLDVATSDIQQITQSLGDIYAPEISPDGTMMVFVSTVNGKQDLYLAALDGSGVIRLTSNPAHDIDPTWSPDGQWIAFTSNRTGTNELYVIRVDGSNERQVTSGGNQREGGRVDWSPDGLWLAFYAGERGDKDLFMVPASCADTGPCGPDQITRLTNGGNNKAPAFSPDGGWITFASELDGNNDIWIMRLDGSDLRQLTDAAYAEWQPRWGP